MLWITGRTASLSLHTTSRPPKVCYSVPCRPEVLIHLRVYSTPRPHKREPSQGTSPHIGVVGTIREQCVMVCILCFFRKMCHKRQFTNVTNRVPFFFVPLRMTRRRRCRFDCDNSSHKNETSKPSYNMHIIRTYHCKTWPTQKPLT